MEADIIQFTQRPFTDDLNEKNTQDLRAKYLQAENKIKYLENEAGKYKRMIVVYMALSKTLAINDLSAYNTNKAISAAESTIKARVQEAHDTGIPMKIITKNITEFVLLDDDIKKAMDGFTLTFADVGHDVRKILKEQE